MEKGGIFVVPVGRDNILRVKIKGLTGASESMRLKAAQHPVLGTRMFRSISRALKQEHSSHSCHGPPNCETWLKRGDGPIVSVSAFHPPVKR